MSYDTEADLFDHTPQTQTEPPELPELLAETDSSKEQIAAPSLPLFTYEEILEARAASAPVLPVIQKDIWPFTYAPESDANRLDHNLKALELIKRLQSDGASPTGEEKKLLEKYTDFGGLAVAITSRNLRNHLSDAEIGQIAKGVENAHYTPLVAVDLVYQILQKLGVDPKAVLDSSCGTGVFFGRMPQHWRDSAQLVATELSPYSGTIAKMLHPGANIEVTDFMKAKLPDNYFDLVVGNVPFGATRLFDPELPRGSLSTHNAFFAKSIRKLKPGGVLACITSSWLMDGAAQDSRKLFAASCNLVGAWRLPSNLFRNTASTRVSSDLIILQKRHDSQASNADEWLDLELTQVTGRTMSVNKYWLSHPARILGHMDVQNSKHAVIMVARHDAHGQIDAVAVAKSLDGLPALAQSSAAEPLPWNQWIRTRHLTETPIGSWVINAGKLQKRGVNGMEPHKLSATQEARVAAMCKLRDRTLALLRMQVDPECTEDDLLGPRKVLEQEYDHFVKAFGFLNAKVNRQLFRADQRWALVASLEVYDAATKTATKSDLLRKRTVKPLEQPKVQTTEQALMASMTMRLKVDFDYMGRLLVADPESIKRALIETERIYFNPASQAWEIAELYLAGDLLKKLNIAKLAQSGDASLARNVHALQQAMPVRVPIEDIEVQLGANYIALDVYTAFVKHLAEGVGGVVAVELKVNGKYSVTGTRYGDGVAQIKWGTKEVKYLDLVEHLLNGSPVTVYKSKADGSRFVDKESTYGAREKLFAIREEFDRWLRTNPEHSLQVEEKFNEMYNTYRVPNFEAPHLVVPGLNTAIELRSIQKRVIWRNLVAGDTLIAHAVGAGKTLDGICIAQMRKMLGLANKPMISIPNHVLGQFARAYQHAFPLANLVVVGSEDMHESKRDITMARMASTDVDCILISHSAADAMPVGEAVVDRWCEEIEQGAEVLLAQAEGSSDVRLANRQRTLALNLAEKYRASQAKRTGLTFEELGIDGLICDEWHAYKNLHFRTTLNNVAGLNMSFSMRALDCLIKTRAVRQRSSAAGAVVTMTATPICNTVAEVYTLMRVMIPERLKELGMEEFDQWRANFGKIITSVEQLPEGGGFRMMQRFASFHNVPELLSLLWSFADIVTEDMLDFPRPEIEGGKPYVVVSKPTAQQSLYMLDLVERARKIRSANIDERPDPKVDNMLKITTDGRKCALDMRLVSPECSDEGGSKLNAAVENIFQVWNDTAAQRLTQLVFCDLGTPNGVTFNVYAAIRDALVKKGVPAEEIAFIHDANTEAKLQYVYYQVQKGILRILIGSTAKMGTGTNVQDRVIASHELDVPYRPDQVIQRLGRSVRQGNINKFVKAFRYVVERTFDAFAWQLVETKMKFIAKVLTGRATARVIEDIDGRALTYAEVKALATGDTRLIRRAELQDKLGALKRRLKTHRENLAQIGRAKQQVEWKISEELKGHKALAEDAAAFKPGNPTLVFTNGEVYDKDWNKEPALALLEAIAEQVEGHVVTGEVFAYFAGLPLRVGRLWNVNENQLFLGETRAATSLSISASGMMRKLHNLRDAVEAKIEVGPDLNYVERLRQQLVESDELTGAPFAQQSELDSVQAELDALELDLGLKEPEIEVDDGDAVETS